MAHKSSHRNSYLLNFNDLKFILIVILKTAAKIQKKWICESFSTLFGWNWNKSQKDRVDFEANTMTAAST